MIDHDNLEEFSDPANYDMEDASDTGIAFYAALAQETRGPVLEIACGTGRVSIPIARLGFSVTGLDIVPGMIERARSKSVGLPMRWIVGDARTFDLSEQFRLIFLTGNAFQAFLTNADQEALLQRVYAHLHDEGLFAFETRNPIFPHSQKGYLCLLKRMRRNKIGSLLLMQVDAKCVCREPTYMTMWLRSTTGRPTNAGTKVGRNTPRSRALPCATPFRRNSRHCCTTMASASNGNMAIGI